MKPIINVNDVNDFQEHKHESFEAKYANISQKIGAEKLGYNITIVPSGKKSWPFHNHHVSEEMFIILDGEGTLRFGDKKYPVKKNDIIACPVGDRSSAHQFINDSKSDLKYLALGTKTDHDICEYPDSDKVLARSSKNGEPILWNISKKGESYEYFEGEK